MRKIADSFLVKEQLHQPLELVYMFISERSRQRFGILTIRVMNTLHLYVLPIFVPEQQPSMHGVFDFLEPLLKQVLYFTGPDRLSSDELLDYIEQAFSLPPTVSLQINFLPGGEIVRLTTEDTLTENDVVGAAQCLEIFALGRNLVIPVEIITREAAFRLNHDPTSGLRWWSQNGQDYSSSRILGEIERHSLLRLNQRDQNVPN